MKLSAQEEYGVRCLIALGRGGSLTIPSLAKREGISQSHVAKILTLLKKEGFINSNRGQIGGYELSRPSEQMFVKDILSALGGKIYRDGFCDRYIGQEPECVHISDCSIMPLWLTIQHAVDEAIADLTLRDLIDPSAGVNVKIYGSPAHMKTVSR